MAAAVVALPKADVSLASELAKFIPEGYQFGTLEEPMLAYQFIYPLQTLSGRKLPIIFSRTPQRYSSVAPLSVDARQRIVAELVDFRNGVTISVSVGKPSGSLKDKDPAEWQPQEVATSVLADRSVARNSVSGKKIPLALIEGVSEDQRNGSPYWTYEHIIQGSPTVVDRSQETYRHAYSATSWRAGQDGTPYLYTLNMSCPQRLWDDIAPLLSASIGSFALTQPGRGYVPPDVTPLLPF